MGPNVEIDYHALAVRARRHFRPDHRRRPRASSARPTSPGCRAAADDLDAAAQGDLRRRSGKRQPRTISQSRSCASSACHPAEAERVAGRRRPRAAGGHAREGDVGVRGLPDRARDACRHPQPCFSAAATPKPAAASRSSSRRSICVDESRLPAALRDGGMDRAPGCRTAMCIKAVPHRRPRKASLFVNGTGGGPDAPRNG